MGMGGGMGGMGGGGMRGMRGMLAMSDEDLGKVFDWHLLKRLFAYVRPYKRHASMGVLAMLVYQAMYIAQPYLPGAAFTELRHGSESGLFTVVGVFFGTAVVAWFAQYQQVYHMTFVGQYVLYDIASGMFQRISSLSTSFFDSNETGRIMARVQNDVTVMQNFLSQGLISTIGNMFSVVGILVVLFVMNWRLAALTSTSIPIFVAALFVWQTFSRKSFRRARATISVVNASLQENVSGVRVIQSMGREATNSVRFDEANTANLQANLGAGRVSAAAQPIVELTSAMSLMMVLGFGGAMVIHGTLALGPFVSFVLYIDRLFDPIRQITQQYNQLQRSTVAAERIFEILDTKSDVNDSPNAIAITGTTGHISFDHVRFGYVPGVNIFEDLNLEIPPGQRVAIVGQTGAGKSTIISLLLRFYDVTGGRILLDGRDIRAMTMKSLRQQMGIVLQDPVLFSGTIAHNIRYGRPDATQQEVETAARDVGLHDSIMRMPHGYDTEVNERGIGLSIGQRQLISFARVLISDPAVLLLDEATASLDTSTELVVQEAIQRIARGRTTIIIAHRLSTIRDADRIIVLENGHIVEEGNHEELIEKRGVYHKLYSLGFETEAVAASGVADGDSTATV
jgi:ABC-type multidrug transport system fused ATPase/permease subunit